jgi:hypothetical protein
VLLSSCKHYSDKKIVVFDDHELISREPEDYSSSFREKVMAEQVSTIDEKHYFNILLKDPVTSFIDFTFQKT